MRLPRIRWRKVVAVAVVPAVAAGLLAASALAGNDPAAACEGMSRNEPKAVTNLRAQASKVEPVTVGGRQGERYTLGKQKLKPLADGSFELTHAGEAHGGGLAFSDPVTWVGTQWWMEGVPAITHLIEPVYMCEELTFKHIYAYDFKVYAWRGDFDTIFGDEETGVVTDWSVYALLETNTLGAGWVGQGNWRSYQTPSPGTLHCEGLGPEYEIPESMDVVLRTSLRVRPVFKYLAQGNWWVVPYGQVRRETRSQELLANGTDWVVDGDLTDEWSENAVAIPSPSSFMGTCA